MGIVSAATITVGNSTEYNCTTISEAVFNASAGDIILVSDGIYAENIVVNKTVTIISENGSASTVVQSSGDHVFSISSDNVTISGFNITGANSRRKAGIDVLSVSNCNISNNQLNGNYYGIVLSSSSNNTLSNNVASNNNNYGILLDDSSNYNTLIDNVAISNWLGIFLISSSNNYLSNSSVSDNSYYGIVLSYSSNNTLINNVMSSNGYNFGVWGQYLSHYLHSIDQSNLVDGKPLYYWTSRSDAQVPSNAGLVYLINSTNITVKDIELTNERYAVLLAYANNSTIENVTVSNCWNGIQLIDSSFNTFESINASNNDNSGFYLDSSSNHNILVNNTANCNVDDGFYLWESSNSILSNNTANSNNDYGFYLYGTGNSDLINNTAIGNIDHDLYSNRENIVENIVVTHNSSTISLITDTNRIQVSGKDTHSTALIGRTNVNGYVDISSSGSAIQNVTFLYDDSGMTGVNEALLKLFRFSGSQWVEVPDSSLNTTGNYISANLAEFGTFGLFMDAESSISTTPSSSSDGSVGTRVRSQGTTTDLPVTGSGEIAVDTFVKSSDTKTTLTLYKGTTAVDPAGNPVNKIIVTKPASLPADTPEDVVKSGLYYDFGPSGTTFSKDVMVSIYFDPGEFEGRAPMIYTYNSEDGWISLETTVDWENGRVTAMTNHFSMYALFGTDASVEEDVVETPEVIASFTKEETPVANDGDFGYLYWITGIGIILVLGIVARRKQKDGGGL